MVNVHPRPAQQNLSTLHTTCADRQSLPLSRTHVARVLLRAQARYEDVNEAPAFHCDGYVHVRLNLG